MITIKPNTPCSFAGCTAIATHIACGQADFYGKELRHPTPDVYCIYHANEVQSEDFPEYEVACPNCHCMFGVDGDIGPFPGACGEGDDVERLNEENSHLHSLLHRTLAAIGEIGPAHTTTDLESIAEEIRAEIGRQGEGRENS